MGIIAWIILGALAGWIASLVMNTDAEQGALANIVVGIIGAILGGFIVGMFGGQSVSGLNLYSLVVSVLGAVVLLFFYKMITRRRTV